MYKLYYAAGACSMAIHIALLECNQQVTLEKVDLTQPRSPEFLKANPRGQVPVLMDGEQVIREGAAIMIHVLEKHKSNLLPQSEPSRTTALEWLMFGNASMHPAYSRCFFLMKMAEAGPAKDKLCEAACAAINKLWDGVEQHLANQPYVCGNDITMADILLTVIANWSPRMPNPINFGPRTKKLFQTVIARPAYMKAMETEQVEYKVAA